MSSVIGEQMNAIAQAIETQLDDVLTPLVLGEGLSSWTRTLTPGGERMTSGALVHLALLNDALVIAEKAVMHDGVVSAEEAKYVTPLAQAAVRYLVQFRKTYEEFEPRIEDVRDFLEQHMNDRQRFGGRCADTRWTGAQVCRNFAINAGDDGPLVDYRRTMASVVDDIFSLTTGSDLDGKSQLLTEIELRSHLERTERVDARAAAFCAPGAGGVFHAVAHADEVFDRDPLDVEAIHGEARDVFARTLSRVSAVNHRSRHGAMLLVKGESGAGKTHLMRAFRNYVHERRLGHVGYLQMTSAGGSYARHILSSLIDSLERAFLTGESSSLASIADSVMRWRVPAALAEALREEADPELRSNVVGKIVDHLVTLPEFTSIDVDLVRAFILLASNDAVVGSRVKRYLRCEQLSDYDRHLLGGMTPSSDENAPLRMLAGIGKLIAASHGGALVLLVDQLEDVYEENVAQARFRSLMDALRQVTEMVPTAFVVVASLGDFYEKLRAGLAKPILDRLEQDPAPVRVAESRTRDEVELLVEMRLRILFEQQGARQRDDEPHWPFKPAQIGALAGLRTRDVLAWCRDAHERCVQAGEIVDFPLYAGGAGTGSVDVAPDVAPLLKPFAAAWTEHASTFKQPLLNDDELEKLLRWSVGELARETGVDAPASLTIGVCNAAPQGGKLSRQVEAIVQRAGDNRIALVRSQDFPAPGRSQVAKTIGEVLKKGGSKHVVRDQDIRTLAALEQFVKRHASSPELEPWLTSERVASKIELVKAIAGDDLVAKPAPPAPPKVPTPEPPPISMPIPSGAVPGTIHLGETRSLSPTPVTRDPATLMRHAAFLGGSGSGKTTLALNIVEQCLMNGVPVLLVDRKGDLCRYGSPSFWTELEPDPARAARKRALHERTRVQVFTPGEHRGRPLALPVIPTGLADVDANERHALASGAAAGLGSMMGYRPRSQPDTTRLAILTKAIDILAQHSTSADFGLTELIDLIHSEDATLVDAIGKLDTRHFAKLVESLQTLQLRHDALLRGGEQMNAELLFGLGPHAAAGKATLSIVSTKFLPDAGVVDFWVSRLLIELTRWSSRHPSQKLQALVLLDEADIYLPAMSQPATKQPMQDLLRRARSAGVGVFLATQSPGDLDYRCRDNITSWFVGRIQERTALEKMKPLLSEYRANPAAKLASSKQGEFFVLAEGKVDELKGNRSLLNTIQLAEDEIIAAARVAFS
jgi:hypothetical protein